MAAICFGLFLLFVVAVVVVCVSVIASYVYVVCCEVCYKAAFHGIAIYITIASPISGC